MYDENDIEHRRSWNIKYTKCKEYSFDIKSQLSIKTRNVSTCDLPSFYQTNTKLPCLSMGMLAKLC